MSTTSLLKIHVCLFGGFLFAELLAFWEIGVSPHGALQLFFTRGWIFFSMAMLDSYLMYLCSMPPKWEFAFFTSLGFCLEIFVCMKYVGIGSGLGCAAFLAFFVNSLRARDRDRQVLLQWFLSALVPPMFILLTPTFLEATVKLNPLTLDHFAFVFDRSLGCLLSFFFAQLFAAVPWFERTAVFFYATLPIAWAVAYVSALRKSWAIALRVFHSFIISAVLANIVFHLFPCGGPKNFFGSLFPGTLPDIEILVPMPMSALTPRNAVPSLHTTWVLLLWWNSRNQSRLTRVIMYLYLVFTLFATLGLGEHYLFDLIVAVPFAVSMQALCFYEIPLTDSRRSKPIIIGLMLFVAALLFARFGLLLLGTWPLLVWIVTLISVIAPLILENRLWQAVETQSETQSPASGEALAA